MFERGKLNPVFVGRYRDDGIQQDGSIKRLERSVVLGPMSELRTKKNAQRAFEPFLARVNSVDYRPGKFAKIGEFADVWEREVLQHQKPSSIKAVKSHMRTYIRPWLAETRMEEFTGQAQQIFITRLSRKVSRKSVQNVVGTLASMLKTAKSWGYVAHPVDMRDLTLPAEPMRPNPRCFSAADLRRIVTVAAGPYRTMFAIAGSCRSGAPRGTAKCRQ